MKMFHEWNEDGRILDNMTKILLIINISILRKLYNYANYFRLLNIQY